MEIFKFMHANKIGHKVALFWRGWAIVAEQNNQYDLVDRILSKAKQMNAQPIKDINKAYDQFLARMRKKIINNDIEVINQMQPQHYNNNKRSTLGQLNNDPTSHRTNHNQARGFGKETKDKHRSKGNKNEGFGIYCDKAQNQENTDPENDGRYLRMNDDFNLPTVSTGWKQLAAECARKKENDGIPTSWNNQGFGKNKGGLINNTQVELLFISFHSISDLRKS